jgi:transcriptional regulator with PAS, ATPase and Fis domain
MIRALQTQVRDVILDSITDGVFTVDEDWRITSFNRAAEQITGVSCDDAVGQRCSDVFRASICESECALKQTLKTGRPVVAKPVYMGRSPAIRRILDVLPQFAESNSTVLIQGASGTGKELIARALHSLSARREKRFVAINCGALPDTLLESELFGYKAGAFTDARRDKPGRFALADGGTILLDEIGDVSPAMQAKLLRVLQERVFEPLGAVEPVKVDVRMIAATNRDLRQLVRRGTFREDLYYRINIVRLELSPLHDRREDIPLLAEHFVSKFNRLQEKHVIGLSEEATTALLEHDYPGNIRELENIIEHAFVLCGSGLIELRHLPPELRGNLATELQPSHGRLTLKALEAVHIRETIRRRGGNRTAAAKELGINPSTLFRKVKSLGIELPEKDGRSKNGE